MGKASTKGNIVDGRTFLAWLERHDMTDANAARLFGTTPGTVGNWIAEGMAGPAAQFLRFLDSQGVSPYVAAGMLGLPFSAGVRSSFVGRAGGVANLRRGGENAPDASGEAMAGQTARGDRQGYAWPKQEPEAG